MDEPCPLMPAASRIEINSKIMLGKPVIRGKRIAVELLLRKMTEGANEADLLDGHPGLAAAAPFAGEPAPTGDTGKVSA